MKPVLGFKELQSVTATQSKEEASRCLLWKVTNLKFVLCVGLENNVSIDFDLLTMRIQGTSRKKKIGHNHRSIFTYVWQNTCSLFSSYLSSLSSRHIQNCHENVRT